MKSVRTTAILSSSVLRLRLGGMLTQALEISAPAKPRLGSINVDHRLHLHHAHCFDTTLLHQVKTAKLR